MKAYDLAETHAWLERSTNYSHGFWSLGPGWSRLGVQLGPQDDNDSIRTMRHAVESGINWVDTAAVYGLGHSEEVSADCCVNCRNHIAY
jgi:aryl-alcohol dehydrogenase-like predicted oxidoreductase